jgi:hypothetical protein
MSSKEISSQTLSPDTPMPPRPLLFLAAPSDTSFSRGI